MIIYFTKYSIKAGSSRVRSFDYLTFYSECNIPVIYSPLFDDFYLFLNNKNFKFLKYIYAVYLYFKRFLFLVKFKFKNDDILIIEKELFPKLPVYFELIFIKNCNYFLDFDDALFFDNNFNFNYKFYPLISNANGVIVCNTFLRDCVTKLGARKSLILPSSVRCDLIPKLNYDTYIQNESFTIGWVGSPSTTKYILDIIDQLLFFKKNYNNVNIIIIGSNVSLFSDAAKEEIQFLDFNYLNIYSIIKMFSVGLMPLRSSDWEMGKCAYKLIQYWACGIPVISSNFGLNAEIVIDGTNGFLFNNSDELLRYLRVLYEDRSYSFRLGSNGFEFANSSFSHKVNFPKLLNFINFS